VDTGRSYIRECAARVGRVKAGSHAVAFLPACDFLADLFNDAGGVDTQDGRVFLQCTP
jgi:hypothetical protein